MKISKKLYKIISVDQYNEKMFKLCCNQINTSNISQNTSERDFLVVQWAETHTPNAESPSPVPGQRSDPIHQN